MGSKSDTSCDMSSKSPKISSKSCQSPNISSISPDASGLRRERPWRARRQPPAMHCAWRLVFCATFCAAQAPRAKSSPPAGLLPVSRASMHMFQTDASSRKRRAQTEAAAQEERGPALRSHIEASSKFFVERCQGGRVGTCSGAITLLQNKLLVRAHARSEITRCAQPPLCR